MAFAAARMIKDKAKRPSGNFDFNPVSHHYIFDSLPVWIYFKGLKTNVLKIKQVKEPSFFKKSYIWKKMRKQMLILMPVCMYVCTTQKLLLVWNKSGAKPYRQPWSSVVFGIFKGLCKVKYPKYYINSNKSCTFGAYLGRQDYWKVLQFCLQESILLSVFGKISWEKPKQYKIEFLYTRCQNVWQGWPVYDVKCLCSRGRKWGKGGCHSHQQ